MQGRRRASSGQAFVPMMQAADLRNGDDVAVRWWLNGTILRAILFEGEMGPGSMVIIEVRRQDTPQVSLVEDDNVIETFAAD